MSEQTNSKPRRRGARGNKWAAWAAPMLAMGACTPAGLLTSFDRISSAADASLRASGEAYGSDPRQKLDVWGPRAKSAQLLPVVVFFYGGGWNEGSRGDYGFAGAAYAGQGFIAVVPDYRLVPRVRFPAFVEDGALAIKWVRENVARLGGDPDRISVAGHSAGAYNAAMIALDPRYLGAVGVDPKVIRSAALLSGPFDFHPFHDARSRNAFGAWPKPAETQPISFVTAAAPPIFLGHGSNDRVVGAHNSRRLAERLRAAGAPVTLRIYPKASHVDLASSLSRPFRDRTPVLAESSDFLRRNSL